MRGNLTDRFWSKVDKSGECWVWTASRMRDRRGNPVYGQLRGPNRTTLRAHRLSYELHFGPVPTGLGVLHRCDNYACVRPEHLYAGTQADNVRDMVDRGRHHRGEAAYQHKLTAEQVRRIPEMRARGMLLREIAAEFGVSKGTIQSIVSGDNWKHLDAA